MIAQINQSNSFYKAAMYNDLKVKSGQATILHTQNLRDTSPQSIKESFEKLDNYKVSKPTLHITLSFAATDKAKLNNEKMLKISQDYLGKMGYGKQPYIVYRHHDTAHPHVHIITSRVDVTTQKKIAHDFENRKSKQLTDKLEVDYGLVISDTRRFRKQEMVGAIQKAMRIGKPRNLANLNQALEKTDSNIRARVVGRGVVYYQETAGTRNSKSLKSALFKDVGLDKKGLEQAFAKNSQQPKLSFEDMELRKDLFKSIESNRPINIEHRDYELHFSSNNSTLDRRLKNLPEGDAISLTRTFNDYQKQYQSADFDGQKIIKNSAEDTLDEYLQRRYKQLQKQRERELEL